MPVYIVRAGDTENVKIGWAEDVDRRLVTLQSGCWLPLNVVRVVDHIRQAETWFHHRFAEFHINGEWFRFHPDMLTADPVAEAPKPVTREPYPQHVELLGEILAFIAGNPMSESTFGVRAINDGKLVGRLRSGAGLTVRTIERVRSFMRASA